MVFTFDSNRQRAWRWGVQPAHDARAMIGSPTYPLIRFIAAA